MILTLIVYRKSDNILKKKKKKSHHLVRAVLISHGNVFLSVKLCFNRKVFCSRKVSKFIIFKTKNSCGLLKVTIQLERIGQNGGKKNPIFFFFFFSALCFARKQSWIEGSYMVASVRWYSFLCWEKSILPESIVKRFNIIRQLVIWLKETPCTRNSHSSLFLAEKLSSPETWIHWKPRLNKTELRKGCCPEVCVSDLIHLSWRF